MKREHASAAIFLVLAAALMVGQRFGFRFAGGTGYEAALVATTPPNPLLERGGGMYTRGETVRTGTDGLRLDLAGLGTVFLDARTDLVIERLAKDGIVLRLEAGRIAVEAGTLPIDVRMDVVEADVTDGRAVFEQLPEHRLVHILPVTGTVNAARRGETRSLVTDASTLFYDRADREPAATVDNLPKNP